MSPKTIDPPPLSHRLRLAPIGERRWRLCDERVSPSDAAYVVAYIEQTSASFDVVWVRGGGLPSHFATFDDVRAAALRLIAETQTHGATRPVPIPHYAPVPH